MASRDTVYLFDLWKTLGFSIDRDPILDVQEALGHNVTIVGGTATAQADPDFTRLCLTTDIRDPRKFVEFLAAACGRKASDEAHAAFAALIARERAGFGLYKDTLPTLRGLQKLGARLGLISNLWPFPVEHIFVDCGLEQYFEHRIYSFETGFAKPDPEIFREAVELFHVHPDDCVMVGDNPVADIEGALAAGMRAALIDRSGKATFDRQGAAVIAKLTDLLKPGY